MMYIFHVSPLDPHKQKKKLRRETEIFYHVSTFVGRMTVEKLREAQHIHVYRLTIACIFIQLGC